MTTLRERAPFRFSEETDLPEGIVLDEQEQEEVISRILKDSSSANEQYIYALDIVLVLSTLLQVIYLVNPSKDSPLLVLFPAEPDPPIPLVNLQTLLCITLHINTFLYNHTTAQAQFLRFSLPNPIIPLYLSYVLAATPPTLSLLLGQRWQTVLWWCFTALTMGIVHFIGRSIENERMSIAELESKKYRAKGA